MILPDVIAARSNMQIPDLSPGISSLLSTLSADNLEVEDVVRELELHPAISARLIGLANSAWSASETVVTDLKTASVRLGLAVVKSSAIAYAVAAPFDHSRCPRFDAKRFWCCCLLGADAAEYLARDGQVDTSLARTGGLLRNLGLLWLADVASQETNAALIQCERYPTVSLRNSLEDTIGICHLQAGFHLLREWSLPTELLDSCDPHGSSDLATIWRLSSIAAAEVYVETDFSDQINGNIGGAISDAVQLRIHLGKLKPGIASIAQTFLA